MSAEKSEYPENFVPFEDAVSPKVARFVGDKMVSLVWQNTRLNTYPDYAHMNYILIDLEPAVAVYDEPDLVDVLRKLKYPEVIFPCPTAEEYDRYMTYGSQIIQGLEPRDFSGDTNE